MQTQTTALSALKDTVRAHPGCRIKFNLTSKETNNALAVLEMQILPGSEPPRHIHENEDETLIIHTGAVTFFIGDDIINAKPGTVVFMPRKTPHHFVVTSDAASCSLILTPGGFENFFEAITFPYNYDFIPEAGSAPSKEQLQMMMANAKRFGVRPA